MREMRVLEGPNLYFPRPAVKVSMSMPGYQSAELEQMRELAERLGLRRAAPGAAHSEQRHRFLVRLVSVLLRRVAARASTRLAVRGRTEAGLDDVVVAFPWRSRGRGEALATSLGAVLGILLDGGDVERAVTDAASLVGAAERGEPAAQLRPRIPVVSVTGTNGKTSTTRLLAHMGMIAGRRTGWSSTEGVFIEGERIVDGDYSGPSGARHVLTAPGVQLGILETARGGLLLKGMGVVHNDVSVVTNVTADHLGLHGVDTVDQLAEVKAIITKVTKKQGWVVLNGDDPRVRAMAAQASGRIWMFSLDPDAPALREALDAGGRGLTVLDGELVMLRRDADPERLVRVRDVPMTLSGLSEHNIANALAAAAAGLGVGLPTAAVVEGLRTFAPDLAHNPGRMNVWTLPLPDGGAGTVIVDIAHNEAGLDALLTVAEGLRLPGSRVHLGLGGVGDRTDEILFGLGEIAGRRADRVQIIHKGHYLRGRTLESLEAQFVQGLAAVGMVASGSSGTEVEGLADLVEQLAGGDVVALMCHAQRLAVVQWLEQHGGTPDSARQVRRKVIAARGEHELESVLAAVGRQQGTERVAAARDLVEASPSDPRLVFELACALNVDGDERGAAQHYREALGSGLREPHRFRAQIGLASCLRGLGERAEALQLLAELAAQRPDSATVAVLRALLRSDEGDATAGVSELADFVMTHATGTEDAAYRPLLINQAQELGT